MRLSRWRGLMSATSEVRRQLETPEEVLDFAAELAGLCCLGDCILLYGDVGAGKTTFARGFIQKIAEVAEEIVSPTFTLVQIYPIKNGGAVWHCDLYRLKNPEELLELGLEGAFDNGIVLVEWPEIAISQLPENSLSVWLRENGDGRSAVVSGATDKWQERLMRLEQWKTVNT